MPSFSVFERASAELLHGLQCAGHHRSVPAGTPLIREGDPPNGMFVLVEGRLSVTTTNQQQQQDQLASLTPGSLVGEMSWLEQRPTVASITAAEPSDVIELTSEALNTFEGSQPDLAAQLHRLIAQKLAVQIQQQNAWVHRLASGPHAPPEALRKVLVLFASLLEQDVHRLARLGTLRRVQANEVLLRQGAAVDGLYLILSGEAEILLTLNGVTQSVGSSRRGELLGEMTLLLEEQRGASAGVQSENGMDLLVIDRQSLLAELKQDPSLASRFYRALACMLSQRSRDQLLNHQRAATSQQAEQDDVDRLDLQQLGAVSRGARHFDWLCRHFQTGDAATP